MARTFLDRVEGLIRLSLVLAAIAISPIALADLGEIDVSFPYSPLGPLGTAVPGVSGVWHGLGNVQLHGWTFPMGNVEYSQFMVSADGFLTAGTGLSVCGCTAASSKDTSCPYCHAVQYGLPNGAFENCPKGGGQCDFYFAPAFGPGMIAPFYSAILLSGTPKPIGTISTLEGGSGSAHYLIVDYDGTGSESTSEYNSSCGCNVDVKWPYQFQAILFESGAVVFDYGTGSPSVTVNGNAYNDNTQFILGTYFPPPSGDMADHTDGGSMLGPSVIYQPSQCMYYWETYTDDACEGSWGQISGAYMGELNSPFLASAPAPSASAGAAGPTIDVTVTITNNGKRAQAAGFPVDFFLVPQGEPPYLLPATCDPKAGCIGSMTFNAPIPVGGQASQTLSGLALPSPLPDSGYYAVASAIDPTNTTVGATAPLLEVGTSTTALAFGQDMTGQIAVSSFTALSATEFTVPLEFTNLGLEDCASVDYELDFVGTSGPPIVAATGTLTDVAALSTVLKNQVVPIPAQLTPGLYQLRLSLGPGTPADLKIGNNVSLGIQRVENGQDMTAAIDAVPFSIPSPTTFQVPVHFRNLGLQPAKQVQWIMTLTSADGANSVQVGSDIIDSVAGLTDDSQSITAAINRALPAGAYTLSLSIVGADPSTPDLDISNNVVVDSTPIFIYTAAVDYGISASDILMNGSSHVADGQVVGVTRTIHNLQGPAGPCPYSYYLNPLGVTQIGDGVPVAILGPNGPTYFGKTASLAAYGQPGDEDMTSDQIVMPDGMPAGSYDLVLALDPNHAANDSNPANNSAAVAIGLSANPLQITSSSSLPAGIIGTPYTYQLAESGAGAQLSWSLLAGALPPGISLAPNGLLSGTPTQAGVFDIVVQLAAGGGTQVAVLQVPVATGTGALQIELSSSALPTAIAGEPYDQTLNAQGGVPPYTWTGTIPPALSLRLSAVEGKLQGTPLQQTNGPIQFTVAVTDSIGSQASATMSLEVITPGALTITTPFLLPAVVGTQYNEPIVAADLAGATLDWSQPANTVLPVGMKFSQFGTPAIADISGTATQAGIFPMVVNVSDDFGHMATRQYILTVTLSPVPMPAYQDLPPAIAGGSYAAQLQTNSLNTVTWRIFSGRLPPGLALTQGGTISGSVPSDATLGGYPFAAAATDANGSESVAPAEILVQASPLAGSGCATGGGPLGAGLLLLALTWLARRRKARGVAR